jgi:hypothetical protein
MVPRDLFLFIKDMWLEGFNSPVLSLIVCSLWTKFQASNVGINPGLLYGSYKAMGNSLKVVTSVSL